MRREVMRLKEIETKSDIEVVNLGTGFGFYDFDYSECKVNACNLSMTQQNLEFDYKLLEYFSERLVKGTKVCIVLPFFIFSANMLPNRDDLIERYYAILPREQVEECCSISYEIYLQHESQRQEEWRSQSITLTECLNEEQMEQQSQEALVNWMKQLDIISFETGEVSERVKGQMCLTKQWFAKILECCEKHGFEPIIIVPPMSSVLLEKIKQPFRETHFYSVLREVLGDRKVEILDYTTDSYFCKPEHYGWPGFLINSVAKEFTKDVLWRIGYDE